MRLAEKLDWKLLKNISSLDSVRNKEGQRLDMFYVLICKIIAPPLIHLLPVRSHCRLYTYAFRSRLRMFYALPKVQHTCNKNA
jgi:hypothetical protein